MTSFARYCFSILGDIWTRLRRAMGVMVPSLVQFIQPALPSNWGNGGTYHDGSPDPRSAATAVKSEKSMDAFAREVRELFEAPLHQKCLLDISRQLQDEYREKLNVSEISMLPSFQHTLPSGSEMGDFLALDVGGSTLRVALIRLGGRQEGKSGLKVRRIRSFVIDEKVRQLAGQAFFDWMAEKIGDMLKEYNNINATTGAGLQMGLAWSFPVEQTSPRSGHLLTMGKGFRAGHGVEGEDLGELIMKSCRRRGLNVVMSAIVNDGAATLLSQAYRDPATRISLILGTGMNAAVFLPTSAIGKGKFGQHPQSWHDTAERVVVNTEISMFGKTTLPVTRWDEQLNAQHRLPNFQPLEYLITGRYLGEIVRLVLLDAIATAGLFAGQIPDRLDEPYAFDTRVLATFESDRSPTLSTASAAFLSAHPFPVTPPTLPELEFIRDVARLASKRGAAYLATALHALWVVRTTAEGFEPGEASHVTIACDGSMVEKYPRFRQATQEYLDQLCTLSGSSAGAVTLDLAPEGSIFGAAVAVSCND